MAFQCFKLKIIIFQSMSEERRIIMRNLLAFCVLYISGYVGYLFRWWDCNSVNGKGALIWTDWKM